MKALYLVGIALALVFSPLSAQDIDKLMLDHGLIDIRSLDKRIRVDLKYSTKDNFIGEDMYGALNTCYLEQGFARRVARAQAELSRLHPGYALLIYDGARPMSVQQRMYARVAGTPQRIYVAPATRGGRHNYGVAVDLTIVDEKGKPLDMGTAFDYFGPEAHLGQEDSYIKSGRFAPEVKTNRLLLQQVMRTAGMRAYDKEWWHFQELISMSEVRRRYKRLDF
ncbi:MAG: M15 family metallopeptidase [Porphyromonas sp.]|nr:M15 family metallopeptidase [Porphyromonas sp.]